MKRDSTSNRDMLRPWRRILGRADDASGSGEEAFRALAEVVWTALTPVPSPAGPARAAIPPPPTTGPSRSKP